MKKWLSFFGLAVLLLGVFAEVSHGMRVKGTSKGSANDQFLFVTRFCFSTNPDGPQGPFDQQGTLEWQAWSPQAHSPLQSVRVLMYNDFDQGSGDYNMSSSWNNVWNNKKLSCDDKVARADQYDAPVLLLAPPPGKATLYLGQKERPHNWYFATSKCNATGPFEVSYDLHFYNPSASAWNREFSCEQQGLLTIYVVFFVLYFVLLALQTWSAWRLAREFTFHPMAKLLTAGLSAMFIAHFSWVIHYGVYANNGVGSPAMKYIGEVFYFLSFMSFLLLLILVAHGWCITRVSLSDLKHRNAIFIFVLCLCVAFLVVFIVQLVNTHPEKSIWIYATPSGIVLDVLMLITMIYVIAVMYFTRQEEGSDEKRRLYFYAFFIAVFWLGITPFMTAVSAGLHSWNYIKIVMAVVEPVYFLCYLGMVILMLPFNALKYFQTKTVDSFESSSGHYDAL